MNKSTNNKRAKFFTTSFGKASSFVRNNKLFLLIVCILSICFFAEYMFKEERDFKIRLLILAILITISYLLLIPIVVKIFKKNKIHIFIYVIFILLLFAILFIAIETFFDAKAPDVKDSEGGINLLYIMSKISLILPLLWLTSHVNGIINKRAKLYVEYEHKQKILEFYIAFKTQFDDDEEFSKVLARRVADVILRYPSIIGEAEETDSPLDKILGKFKSKNTQKANGGSLAKRILDLERAVDRRATDAE